MTVWIGLFCVLWITGCSPRPRIGLSGIYKETEADSFSRSDVWDTARADGDFEEKGRGPDGADEDPQTGSSSLETSQEEEPQTEAGIMVYVCGAVQNPGVYSLKEYSRVYEAIQAAGGFSSEADQEWVNQARVLQDGQKLKIYTLEETRTLDARGSSEGQLSESGDLPETQGDTSTTQSGLVNLNTASKEELMTLPGIGESKAEAVIRHRQEQGKFQTIEDIMQISGIKDAVFAKIKDRITV